ATYYFVKSFGIPGMALAFSLTSIINLLILMAELHYKIGNIHDQYLTINTLKILIATALSSAACYGALYAIAPVVNMHTYWGIFLQAAGAGTVGALIFVAFGWLFGLSDAHNLLKATKSVLIKSTRPITILMNFWN
ncbi:MAG: hypothetical protein ACM3KM_00705, partial [Acidobacteriaceae bacterium]